jgi:hypothetical protein
MPPYVRNTAVHSVFDEHSSVAAVNMADLFDHGWGNLTSCAELVADVLEDAGAGILACRSSGYSLEVDCYNQGVLPVLWVVLVLGNIRGIVPAEAAGTTGSPRLPQLLTDLRLQVEGQAHVDQVNARVDLVKVVPLMAEQLCYVQQLVPDATAARLQQAAAAVLHPQLLVQLLTQLPVASRAVVGKGVDLWGPMFDRMATAGSVDPAAASQLFDQLVNMYPAASNWSARSSGYERQQQQQQQVVVSKVVEVDGLPGRQQLAQKYSSTSSSGSCDGFDCADSSSLSSSGSSSNLCSHPIDDDNSSSTASHAIDDTSSSCEDDTDYDFEGFAIAMEQADADDEDSTGFSVIDVTTSCDEWNEYDWEGFAEGMEQADAAEAAAEAAQAAAAAGGASGLSLSSSDDDMDLSDSAPHTAAAAAGGGAAAASQAAATADEAAADASSDEAASRKSDFLLAAALVLGSALLGPGPRLVSALGLAAASMALAAVSAAGAGSREGVAGSGGSDGEDEEGPSRVRRASNSADGEEGPSRVRRASSRRERWRQHREESRSEVQGGGRSSVMGGRTKRVTWAVAAVTDTQSAAEEAPTAADSTTATTSSSGGVEGGAAANSTTTYGTTSTPSSSSSSSSSSSGDGEGAAWWRVEDPQQVVEVVAGAARQGASLEELLLQVRGPRVQSLGKRMKGLGRARG